jgi:large subunit ribosomal protein L40
MSKKELIRYFLSHPLTPRPLRFSRERYLRHWTIHRAWQIYKAQLRTQHERDLERQYQSMRDACEALRLMDSAGNIVKEGEATAQGKNVGRLYRIAMMKNDIWGGVPIEYARIQTDSPSTDGWNHGWTR